MVIVTTALHLSGLQAFARQKVAQEKLEQQEQEAAAAADEASRIDLLEKQAPKPAVEMLLSVSGVEDSPGMCCRAFRECIMRLPRQPPIPSQKCAGAACADRTCASHMTILNAHVCAHAL